MTDQPPNICPVCLYRVPAGVQVAAPRSQEGRGMKPTPVYPMGQCLDGRHPPFNLEAHPDGCPAHAAKPRSEDAAPEFSAVFTERGTVEVWDRQSANIVGEFYPAPRGVVVADPAAISGLAEALDRYVLHSLDGHDECGPDCEVAAVRLALPDDAYAAAISHGDVLVARQRFTNAQRAALAAAVLTPEVLAGAIHAAICPQLGRPCSGAHAIGDALAIFSALREAGKEPSDET